MPTTPPSPTRVFTALPRRRRKPVRPQHSQPQAPLEPVHAETSAPEKQD